MQQRPRKAPDAPAKLATRHERVPDSGSSVLPAAAKPAPKTRNGAPDPSRPIKGSKNSRGKRIYHMPGSPAYDEVEIDEREGERWFASAEEAERAGWQPAGGGR